MVEHGLLNGVNNRRSFIKFFGAAPLFVALASRSVASTVAATAGRSASADVYTRLGVRPFINARGTWTYLSGSLELSGSAETVVGQHPAAVTATALPLLGHEVSQPGEFDVILPVRIGYDVMKDKITQVLGGMAPAAGMSVRDVEVYPSSGKLVVGLRIAKASDTDANAGQWTYLVGSLKVDADGHAIRLPDLSATTNDEGLAALVAPIVSQLRERVSVDYGVAYENLLNAANAKLNRALKDGYRMEGHLSSAKLEKVYLPADGLELALRASGELKILHGM